eukprot:1157349-Pelagomonas_calceolata.AAC.3
MLGAPGVKAPVHVRAPVLWQPGVSSGVRVRSCAVAAWSVLRCTCALLCCGSLKCPQVYERAPVLWQPEVSSGARVRSCAVAA